MSPRSLSSIITASIAALLLMSCASVPMQDISWAESWIWTQPVDSLSLPGFLDLPVEVRRQRRSAAENLLDHVEAATSHAGAMALLTTAAGLAPDDALLWIRLAAESRRIGDCDRALGCLEAAERALQHRDDQQRRQLRLEVALARGWIHRDRGEWAMAVAWSDSARSLEPQDRRVQLLVGIASASRGDTQGATNMARIIEVTEFFRFEWRWIRGMASFSQGDLQDAYHWLSGARPEQPWSADFWRDFGMVCERVGDQIEASRAYRYALASLGLPSGTTGSIETSVRSPGRERGMDVVLHRAYEGWPVAGSRLGWAFTAADSALSATHAGRLAHWSDRASELLSTAISYEFETRRCRELRGLVYARVGAEELARRDFQRAVTEAADLGEVDSRVLLELGHMILKEKRWRRSIPLLKAGLERSSQDARGWGDLGLALLMTSQKDAGNEALSYALELDPTLAAAWYNRGLARFHAKQWRSAADDLAQAAELAPDNQEVLDLLQQAEQRARLKRR